MTSQESAVTPNTYAKLFPEQLSNTCSPEAPEANCGPIAYLNALYQHALSLEASSTASDRMLLAQRRPDIGELLLDPHSLEQPLPALTLAIRALTRQAQGHAGADAYLPEELAYSGQHAGLPFHYANEQIKAVLKQRQVPHFELLQKAEYSYPNFCNGRLRTPELRQVMRNASGFSPELQALLLDEKALKSTGDGWRAWYGYDETVTGKQAITELLEVQTYCQRTGLSTEQVLEMIAVSGIDDNAKAGFSAVRTSSAYRPSGKPLANYYPGAVFINARRKQQLNVKDAQAAVGIRLQFSSLDYDCLSRMYQMIHLQRELALPFAEVDLLLISILRAEGQEGNWHLSTATLRALGVFRYLNEAYGVSAEQFAALVLEVSPHTVGERVPMLDRVLDGPGSGQIEQVEAPLVLDDRTFDPNDGADGQLKVLPALCAALGASEATTRDYLQQARQALGLSKLTLSLPLFSSLYRLSRLHRLFKRSALEGQALIRLLGQAGESLNAQLAGKPQISDPNAPDVLDMLVALSNLDQWLRQEQILPTALLGALSVTDGAQIALDSKLEQAICEMLPTIRKAMQGHGGTSAEEALAATLLIKAFGSTVKGMTLEQQHIAPLLRWSATSAKALLEDVLKAAGNNDGDAPRLQGPLDTSLWPKVARHCALIHYLRLSPGVLQALCDHPQWFDLEESETPPEASAASIPPANLDQCYQLSRLRQWIEVCRRNGSDENDATLFLTQQAHSIEPNRVAVANERLSTLIGWPSAQLQHALPHVEKITYIGNTRPTFDDFLTTLTATEKSRFQELGEAKFFREVIFRKTGAYTNYAPLQGAIDKLVAFLEDNPGPLVLTPEQYEKGHKPELWAKAAKEYQSSSIHGYFPLELEALANGQVKSIEWIPCVPTTISDIDFILRLKGLCERTGLSSEALLDLSALQETSDYDEFQASSQLLLAGGDDALRETVEPPMQEAWRDALVSYLLTHWVPASPLLKAHITGPDALSDYCLTDVAVSSQVNTTPLNHAIGSLQNYMFRLFAHLEPGYTAAPPSSDTVADWQARLGQYGTWKQRQEQYNHPENLIHYSNRPNKSVAFQELEVELNQGKLDTSMLHTAICNYLAKFERVSNLQVVSGYLEGSDPRQGVYHLIGKTNSTPPEYFWRTLDMGLRDDKQRLSPLAWSEWEKIGLSPTGKIPESYYEEKKNDEVVQTFTCDAIRPVIIEGRRYVFWVERGTTDLPSGESSNKTLPKMRKISVHYAFQQSDGNWSTGNELMCLDGHDQQGKWAGDSNDNAFLKNDKYIPGLIVVVDEEERDGKQDPWLVAMLYNCAGMTTTEAKQGSGAKVLDPEKFNNEYFVEARDLLLIDKKNLGSIEKTSELVNTLFYTYSHVNCVQHSHNGRSLVFRQVAEGKVTPYTESYVIEEGDPYLKVLETFFFSTVSGMNKDRSIAMKFGFKAPANPIDSDPPENKFDAIDVFFKNTKDLDFRHYDTFELDNLIKREYEFPYYCYDLGTYSFRFSFNTGSGSLRFEKDYIFELEGVMQKDEAWDILIKRNTDQAQYLDLTTVASEEPKLDTPVVHLNTLFGMNLVARASQGVEQVLAWATQCLQEPQIDSNRPNPKLDFHGANGLYFRELFLHLPALVATRLTEQRQFEEAEDWYQRYLFAPYRIHEDEQGRPAPWCTRPLAEVGSLSSSLQLEVDPVSRVFVLSRYYQQAVYLSLLENWRLQGDHFYRQPSLSNLNHAWLCYQQALRLLGPLPHKDEVSRWQPVALAELDAAQFRRPLNGRVIELRNLLENRLYNLRHGLSLDGKALPPLTWADESLDAFANAQGGVSLLPQPYVRGRAPIPAYRFRQLLPLAKAAAQQLLDFGRHYLRLIEEDSNVSESVMLKAHEIKLAEFTTRIQKEAINGLQVRKSGMLLSREAAKARHTYLSKLIDVGRSPEEEAATALTWLATSQRVGGIIFQQLGALVDTTVPNIYGFSIGGNRLGAGLTAGGVSAEILADISQSIAGELQVQAEYNRRAAEWEFDRSQVEWDIKVLDEELKETGIELNAATIALAQCEQDRINLQEAYLALTEDTPFYNWLVARQEQIYGTAYDAVRSLCLGVEEAWRYEIGDYQRESFIDTTAWRDNYKGMLVGESLLNDLQHMENQYLLANERRLTIRKAFSLKARVGINHWVDSFKETAGSKSRTHTFEFKAVDFDQSYPGHYLRQLKYVSVTFVLKAGSKLEDLSAILTQTGSTTLLEANNDAVEALYKPAIKLKDPKPLLRNPRQNQQIALSSTVAEDGLGYEPGTWVYELMFHDGRYLPFEGTGAISEWTLEILGGAALKDPSIIEDITFNMVYTAKAGDSAFTEAVRKLS